MVVNFPLVRNLFLMRSPTSMMLEPRRYFVTMMVFSLLQPTLAMPTFLLIQPIPISIDSPRSWMKLPLMPWPTMVTITPWIEKCTIVIKMKMEIVFQLVALVTISLIQGGSLLLYPWFRRIRAYGMYQILFEIRYNDKYWIYLSIYIIKIIFILQIKMMIYN